MIETTHNISGNKDFNLKNHRAYIAWNKLKIQGMKIREIKVIHEVERSFVYCMKTVGSETPNIIAKRSVCLGRILKEKDAYQNILPFVNVTVPQFYGLIAEKNSSSLWLFIEDVDGEEYLSNNREHCLLAGKWLGQLHVETAILKERQTIETSECNQYKKFLYTAPKIVAKYLSNPNLTKKDIVLLKAIVNQVEIIKHNWKKMEIIWFMMPEVFVHGDYKADNLQILTDPFDDKKIICFDWESGRWTRLAIDVTKLLSYPVSEKPINADISAYCDVVQKKWSFLDVPTVQRFAYIGEVLRWVKAIFWLAKNLKYEWLEKTMFLFNIYKLWMDDILDASPWADDYIVRDRLRPINIIGEEIF